MIIPETGSLWRDMRPFSSRDLDQPPAHRYVIVLGPAHDEGFLKVVSWWDTPGGRVSTRREYTLDVKYFQPLKDGSWSKSSGYRPARREPKYGRATVPVEEGQTP